MLPMAERTNLLGPVLVAAFCALVLSITHLTTAGQIADNQRAHDQRALRDLLGETLPDTALLAEAWQDDQIVWCAQRIVAARLQADGYAGPIELLLAWRSDQREIIGVSVVRHLETPGIADFLNDHQQGSWLDEFRTSTATGVGHIDAVTGATISSNAVRQAVAQALQLPDPANTRCRS
jgi:RnfABCDGE-type electron transport complex G subunit